MLPQVSGPRKLSTKLSVVMKELVILIKSAGWRKEEMIG